MESTGEYVVDDGGGGGEGGSGHAVEAIHNTTRGRGVHHSPCNSGKQSSVTGSPRGSGLREMKLMLLQGISLVSYMLSLL